ncbi:hypothetical protein [Sedimenticola hydrogenitrophicus]|uniref:hypothetical protein n=1 Tax=Sedimenticola hydrogenitrophicus TaxID=2967975 RepID=UPI0023B0A5FE|nr:hypothetical protein [Sedimenticola hydrogenitrophicus]
MKWIGDTCLKIICIAVIAYTFLSGGVVIASDLGSDSIKKLEECSQEQLGIRLKSLKYLLDLNPNDFILRSSINGSGEMEYIEALQDAGFVRILLTDSLPNGVKGPFIRLIPTEKASDLLEYLR